MRIAALADARLEEEREIYRPKDGGISFSLGEIMTLSEVPHPAHDALELALCGLSDDELFTIERLMYLGRNGESECLGHDRLMARLALAKPRLGDFLRFGLDRSDRKGAKAKQ